MICLDNIEANPSTLHCGKKYLAVGVVLEAIQLLLALMDEIAVKPEFNTCWQRHMSTQPNMAKTTETSTHITYRAQSMPRSSMKIPSSKSNPPLKKLKINACKRNLI
jgi:hypothetical protein